MPKNRIPCPYSLNCTHLNCLPGTRYFHSLLTGTITFLLFRFFCFAPLVLSTHSLPICTTDGTTDSFPVYLQRRILFRRRSKKLASLSQQKSALPIAGLPVNCCGPTPSPNGPLGSLATLSAFNSHKVKKSIFGNRNKLTITKL